MAMSSGPMGRAGLWSAWVHVVQRLAFLTCRLLIESYSSTAAIRVSIAPWMASASVGAMRRSQRVDWVIILLRNTTVVALMLACCACWSLFVWRWSGLDVHKGSHPPSLGPKGAPITPSPRHVPYMVAYLPEWVYRKLAQVTRLIGPIQLAAP